MNKETLKQIKQEYNEMHKISKGDLREIEELEKNPIVQRYKYLLDRKKSFEQIDDYYRPAQIFGEIINKYGNGLIDSTNDLWFWFLNVPASQYEQMFNESLEKIDHDSIVSVYLDIENSKRVIAIPIEEQSAFEATNKVIRGKRTIDDAQDRYYNARYQFFNLCISEGQEVAIKTMLHEEYCRLEETKKARDAELKKLAICLKYNLITPEEYEKRRQPVLAKK